MISNEPGQHTQCWHHFLMNILDSDYDESQFQSVKKIKCPNENNKKCKIFKGFQVLIRKEVYELKNESIFFIETNIREFINDEVLKQQRQHQFFLFIKFMAKKSRNYLRQICNKMNKTNFNLALFSGRVEIGLWMPAVYSPLNLLDTKKT